MFYDFARAIVKFAFMFVFRVKVVGKENIPNKGGVIIAVNHRSNFDPVIAAIYCKRRLNFMAKEELFKRPVFGRLIARLGAFPVSRGSGDVSAVKAAFGVLKKEGALLMFPQGRRMKNGQRGTAHQGVAMIAHKMKVPVIPMLITGDYKFMSKITVQIGTPMDFSEYYGQKLEQNQLRQLSESVLDAIFLMQN